MMVYHDIFHNLANCLYHQPLATSVKTQQCSWAKESTYGGKNKSKTGRGKAGCYFVKNIPMSLKRKYLYLQSNCFPKSCDPT